MDKNNEIDKRLKKITKEIDKRLDEESGNGGYFTRLWGRLGDVPETNLKRFFFKKEVLNAYSQEIPIQRFIIERGTINYLKDKEKIWDLKFSEDTEFVSAILVDLTQLPKKHQDWWEEHLVDKN